MGNPETDAPGTPPGGEGGQPPPSGKVRPKRKQKPGKKGKGGRKPKLTPERLENLTTSFIIGLSPAEACEAADISTRTFERWLATGRAERKGLHWQLVKAVERIKGKRKHRWLTCVNIAAETNPTAAMWLLERYFPKEFHLGARIHVTQEIDDVLDLLERTLPPDLYEQILASIVQRQSENPAGGTSREA